MDGTSEVRAKQEDKGPFTNDVRREGEGGVAQILTQGGCVILVLWIGPKC